MRTVKFIIAVSLTVLLIAGCSGRQINQPESMFKDVRYVELAYHQQSGVKRVQIRNLAKERIILDQLDGLSKQPDVPENYIPDIPPKEGFVIIVWSKTNKKFLTSQTFVVNHYDEGLTLVNATPHRYKKASKELVRALNLK